MRVCILEWRVKLGNFLHHEMVSHVHVTFALTAWVRTLTSKSPSFH
jgi:hypothetical protein